MSRATFSTITTTVDETALRVRRRHDPLLIAAGLDGIHSGTLAEKEGNFTGSTQLTSFLNDIGCRASGRDPGLRQALRSALAQAVWDSDEVSLSSDSQGQCV